MVCSRQCVSVDGGSCCPRVVSSRGRPAARRGAAGNPAVLGRRYLLGAYAFHSDSLRALFLGEDSVFSGRTRGPLLPVLPQELENTRCARSLPSACCCWGLFLALPWLKLTWRAGSSSHPQSGGRVGRPALSCALVPIKVRLSGAGRVRLRVNALVLPSLPGFRQA